MNLNGGSVLINCLKALGARHLFAVPGESYLAALDALYDHDDIELITCRQEGGAAMMADAYGKLTGRPGICFVTRGPGATNASAGVHIAAQDSTPMILFIGQVATDMMEREAFQEIDYRRFFSPMVKWAAQIDNPGRICEFVSRAYHTAVNGRPGPVVLALPENVLSASTSQQPLPEFRPNHTGVPTSAITELTELLQKAERPLILTGRAGWSTEATKSLQIFAENNRIPVAATFRCQDTFDNRHPNYIGDVGIGINPELAQIIKQADTLVLIGARLGEMTTAGYSLIDVPLPKQSLIHVYPGAEEINRTYAVDLAINCSATAFCRAIETLQLTRQDKPNAVQQYRSNYLNWNEAVKADCDVQLSEIVKWLSDNLPDDAILTNGAGNYSAWLHRFFQYKHYHTQLAPTSGSMGYGLPAALAAKTHDRNKTVVCFAGDGCLQMTIQELATAVQFNLNIIVIVINNNSWGTIRMHQEKTYPGRVKGTDLVNPDFTCLAKAYGLHSESVSKTQEFAPAFTRAVESGRPALIEIQHPLEVINPTTRLGEL